MSVSGCGCRLEPVNDTLEPCDLCSEATETFNGIGWRIVRCPAHEAGRAAYDDGLADGFAACEALVSAGLQALAEAEDMLRMKAQAVADTATTEERTREARAYAAKHFNRCAALREAALAVSVGQFRTAEANERAVMKAHATALSVAGAAKGGRARSPRKTHANQINGAMGGRPRKSEETLSWRQWYMRAREEARRHELRRVPVALYREQWEARRPISQAIEEIRAKLHGGRSA